MKRTKNIIIGITIFILAAGCGARSRNEQSLKDRTMANTPDDYSPITAILGENPNLDVYDIENDTGQEDIVASNEVVTTDKDYVGGTMAIFNPIVVANGKEVKATYKITTANAQASIVMENVSASQEMEVAPGVYDITFKTKAIAGDPEMTLRGVELVSGRRLNRKIKFPVGEITLITGGKRCKKKKITLKLVGSNDWLPGKYFTCKPIKLMAGEYEAKYGIVDIKGITVYDGGTRKVSIRSQ